MQLEPGHPWHLHIGDHAACAADTARAQKLLRGCEGLDPISQRPHETLYGLAHRLVVVDDRNQRLCLWHSTSCTRASDGKRCDAIRGSWRRVIFTASQEDETNSSARRLYFGLDRFAARSNASCTAPRFVAARCL